MRTILCLLAALIPVCLGAQVYEPVRLTINSTDGIFAKGDSIKVTARISSGAEEELLLQVMRYGEVINQKTLSLSEGEYLVYADAFNEKTSVMVNLGPASDPKKFTAIGFLVCPEEFQPGFSAPKNLAKYWEKDIKRMRKLKPVVKTYPAIYDDDETIDTSLFECYKIEINMPDGRPCRGYVAYPKGAELKSLPIFVWLHGAGVSKRGHRALASRVLKEASRGCIALDINAHGFEDDQPRDYYLDLEAGDLRQYSSRDFMGKGDYYFHNMFLRDVRALDYATTLPYWDGQRIIVFGSSQGGGQALALAGIDPRVTHCVAIVPALTDMGAVLDGRKCGWPSAPNTKNAQTYLGPKVMAYHDGALLVSMFKGELYLEAGNIDLICDPACVAAAYNNAGSVKSKQIHFFPRRPHGDKDLVEDEAWNELILQKREAFLKEAIRPLK
ncbi:MAG: alpha/beta fold hydrolase [Bacteroidales bacterium]|nr:alpha/beta fold hydrolase [Bacteroidales bacterium]